MGRITFALLLIGMGLFMILDRTHWFPVDSLLETWWPLLLIAVGVAWWLRGSRNSGLFIALIGLYLQLLQINALSSKVREILGPLIIILIGIWLLSSRRSFSAGSRSHAGGLSAGSGSRAGVAEGETLNSVSVFGDHDERVVSQQFRGGKATAIFSDIDIDLRSARFAQRAIDIEVIVIFGDLELWVPENCNVILEPALFLADAKSVALQTPHEEQEVQLRIHGVVAFGSVRVRR